MAFEDLAPTLAGLGFTETQANNFFTNKIKLPGPPEVPEMTSAKAVDIAQALYVVGIEQSGGITKLAQSVKLRTSQVKMIIRELKALEAAWMEAQEPPGE